MSRVLGHKLAVAAASDDTDAAAADVEAVEAALLAALPAGGCIACSHQS